MVGLSTLDMNIKIIEGIQDGQITARQTEVQFNGVWRDMTLEKTYNRDAKTKLFTGICHQPAAIVKYWRALTVLTAESEQTTAMTHLDLDDTKHHEDTNRQAESDVEGVKNITGVINNQTIHPFKCEKPEMVNISTGHKVKSAELARDRGIGIGMAPVAARETGSDKVST